MLIREVKESDYLPVITVLNEWWGGRQMAGHAAEIVFQAFLSIPVSLLKRNGQILGFLIGFVSQGLPPNRLTYISPVFHPRSSQDRHRTGQFMQNSSKP